MLNMARRQKYSNNGSRTISFSERKIKKKFSIETLNLMFSFVLSENKNIKMGQLINMRNLIECLDTSVYKDNITALNTLRYIKKGLEGRTTKGLNNPDLILQYINGGMIDLDSLGVDLETMSKLSSQELEYVNETVTSALKYAFIYNDTDKLYDALTRFKADDYNNTDEMVNEIELYITELQNKFRRAKMNASSETEFRLKKEILENSFRDIYDKLNNPSSLLVTGMQGLNELLGDGFYGTRVYMLLGLTGGGKSLTLLDLCTQLKKYNKKYKTKDPSKRPCIVYLTMENTVEETVQRLFDMLVGRDIKEFTYEEALEALMTDGELCLSDDNPIDIIIKFKPNKSVDTSYLYTLTEDLEDDGYEVIAMVQDHVGRIRSTENLPDTRLELGTVVNEFKTYCQLKEIPLITNFHLNRDAATRVDEAYKASKSDLVRVLGRDNVAESQFMINNLDACYMITQETDSNNNRWLGIMRTKIRYKASDRNVIFLPYKENSPKLIEDYNEKVPVFRDSLRDNVQFKNSTPKKIPPKVYNGDASNIDEILNSQTIIKGDKNMFDTNSITGADPFENPNLIPPVVRIATGNRTDIKKQKRVFMTRIEM